MNAFRFSIVLLLQIMLGGFASAAITDFETWTPVEDPDHAGLSASVDPSSATLSAGNLAVPAGTDIGFQSVNGSTPASSSQGYYFSPLADFSLAIDYSWTFSNNPSGFLGLGFGIGEDSDGMNSAGVAMATSSGTPFLTFGGAGRVNDSDRGFSLGNPLFNTSTLSGTLFVEYEATSGSVIVGAAPVTSAAAPTLSDDFDGIQKEWAGGNLMTSFFIRSDEPTPGTSWSGGNADAVFSNFRVLSGNPVAIPEPTGLGLLATLGIIATTTRRRNRDRR